MKKIALDKLPWLENQSKDDDALLVDIYKLDQTKGLAFSLKDLFFEAHIVEPYSDENEIDYTVYLLDKDNKLQELDGGQENTSSDSFKLLGIILLYVNLFDREMVEKYICHLNSEDITFYDWDDFISFIDE